ncbi:MAG: Bax inhibitor-1/YccA family protein [Gemmatimonadaceae bacterium]|nr:Bax inhibitor-1/YccA family protein [Chitinophagaceae bacterium]
MAIFKSGNPALSEKSFEKTLIIDSNSEVMTERGTLNKFILMALLLMGTASITWSAYYQGKDVMPWIIGGAIGGIIIAIILVFKKQWGSVLAPLYALCEGAFVGGISAYYSFAFETIAPGIVMQAVALTFGAVIAMFALYRFGVIKATEKFKSVIFIATAAIGIFYLIAFFLRMGGVQMAFLHEGSMLGIGFSVFVVAIAALNLILDFDMIEKGAAMGAPKYMEWYGAFGLMVTIVWLYIEILRLLGKLNSRD